MSDLRLLRLLIAAWWALLLIGFALDVALEGSLPSLLQQYLESEEYYSGWLDSLPEWLALVILLPLVVAIIVSSIGLYFAKPWSRLVYSVLLAVGLLIAPGFAPSVSHPFAELPLTIVAMLDGAILLLIWRSSIFKC